MNPCLQVLERAVRERQVAELAFSAGDNGGPSSLQGRSPVEAA